VSIIGVSGAGAVSHNIGQLLVASYIVRNWTVMMYLPVLTFIGIGTGIFIGAGENDPIVPFDNTMDLEKVLKEMGAEVSVHRYMSGHSLTAAEVKDASSWYQK